LLNYTIPELPVPIQLEALPLYQKDYIGLKVLKQANKLHYGLCAGEHVGLPGALLLPDAWPGRCKSTNNAGKTFSSG
jgi:hypothetical protein